MVPLIYLTLVILQVVVAPPPMKKHDGGEYLGDKVPQLNANPNDKIPQVPQFDGVLPGQFNSSNTVKTNSFTDSSSESGALMRGVYVFVTLSILFFIYLAIKTYRNRRMPVTIRKYGVRTRRSDMEMEPLPLDDNEEDDTVFDIGMLNKQ